MKFPVTIPGFAHHNGHFLSKQKNTDTIHPSQLIFLLRLVYNLGVVYVPTLGLNPVLGVELVTAISERATRGLQSGGTDSKFWGGGVPCTPPRMKRSQRELNIARNSIFIVYSANKSLSVRRKSTSQKKIQSFSYQYRHATSTNDDDDLVDVTITHNTYCIYIYIYHTVIL